MANISKKAAKKAHKREKHLLAKQTAQPEIQIATKLAPIAATSPPVMSNTATSATTIATGTVKTVAELDAKLNRMEQQWAKTSTSPLPGGIQNAVMALRATLVIQEAAAAQPVEAPIYNVLSGNGGDVKASEEEMESTIRRGEKEKESANEEKVEARTAPNNLGDDTPSQAPAEHINTPITSPRCVHIVSNMTNDTHTLPKPTVVLSTADMAHITAQTGANEGIRGVRKPGKEDTKEVHTTINTTGDDVTCPAPSSFDWAEDVDATVTPTPIALVAPATHAPRDFSVLRSNNRNPCGSLSRRHHRSQPRICNSFNSRKYNTNYAYKPTTPSSAPAPVHLVETIRHPCGIAPTKPVIRTSSAVSTPILHSSMSTHSCEPLSAVRSDSSLWPSYTPSLDWSGDPLLAGLARILEALGWTRGCVAARTPLCLRGAHGVVGFGGADPLVA